jgi:hypothetical protein
MSPPALPGRVETARGTRKPELPLPIKSVQERDLIDLSTQPVTIDTGSKDREGLLVFADGLLVAVLVQLRDEAHEELQGTWWLEAGFGPCSVIGPPLFADLDKAQDWIRTRFA